MPRTAAMAFENNSGPVEPPEDGEREDHVLVLAALEGVADEIRNSPDETCDLAVMHSFTLQT